MSEKKPVSEETIKKIADQEKIIAEHTENIVTYKFAIYGLIGRVPEYITNKLIEIAKKISSEEFSIQFAKDRIKDLKEGK